MILADRTYERAIDARTVDYLAWRLGPVAALIDLPTDPFELWMWVVSALADVDANGNIAAH